MADYPLMQKLKIRQQEYTIHNITILEKKGLADISSIPFSARIFKPAEMSASLRFP